MPKAGVHEVDAPAVDLNDELPQRAQHGSNLRMS
jgi:hypothetical protein